MGLSKHVFLIYSQGLLGGMGLHKAFSAQIFERGENSEETWTQRNQEPGDSQEASFCRVLDQLGASQDLVGVIVSNQLAVGRTSCPQSIAQPAQCFFTGFNPAIFSRRNDLQK